MRAASSEVFLYSMPRLNSLVTCTQRGFHIVVPLHNELRKGIMAYQKGDFSK